MYPSIEALETVARLLAEERELLISAEAPIVLVPKERFRRPTLEALAPDNPALGVFLPYSPLHLLILGELGAPLVMTSANMPGDPLIIDDEAALTGLAGVVDAWIWNDRRIESRVDDSVVAFQGFSRRGVSREYGTGEARCHGPSGWRYQRPEPSWRSAASSSRL